ncbi:MAG: AI-2E family transporter [Armatimonadota bacterium]|nr:AI-2E family transporter [Armatimonadota bacterium]
MLKEFKQQTLVVWAVIAHVLIALAAVLLIGTVFYHAMNVVVMLCLAVVLALLLNPLVVQLSKGMPRWLAIMTIYLVLVGILVALGILLVPRLIEQGHGLVTHWLPTLKPRLLEWYDLNVPQQVHDLVDANMPQLQDQLQKISKGGMEQVIGMSLGGAKLTMSLVLTLVMSIYLLADRDHFVKWFQGVTPAANQARLQGVFEDVVGVLRAYIRGLAVMVLFVGITVSLLLFFFHIRYWLFIGVMAGILEVIPYFGAVAGAIPALTLGFQHSNTTGIILIVFFILINQLEGHVVAPLAMGHSMHLRPLTVLLSLLVGAEVHGVLGMIVAVPFVGIVRVMWEHGRNYVRRNIGEPSQAQIVVPGQSESEHLIGSPDGHSGNSHVLLEPSHKDTDYQGQK